MRHCLSRGLLSLVAPALFLLFWHYASLRIDNPVVLPQIGEVLSLLLHPTENLLNMGSLVGNVTVSFVRVFGGYLLAVFVAVPLGLAMGYWSWLNRMLGLMAGLFRPIPPLSWIPLVLAWFGVASMATILGIEEGAWYPFFSNIKLSMLFIIFIGAFFPILVNTIGGVQSVRVTLIDAVRVLGASPWQIVRYVVLPYAAPQVFTGLRVGLGVAWMCLVSAEMMPGSISGVGYLITHAYTVAQTDVVIAGMIAIGVMGIMIDSIFMLIERRAFQWQSLYR
nr:ABC transporter permease [uncultured Fretibacterium sp.]